MKDMASQATSSSCRIERAQVSNHQVIRPQSRAVPSSHGQENTTDRTGESGSRSAKETDPASRCDMHVVQVWIIAGGAFGVAVAAGVQVYQLLGSPALALIASVTAFLMVFGALVFALRVV